jgi:Mrp family chromosome partitioning ATPase
MVLEYANRTIRDASEIELLTDLPLLGTVRPPPGRVRRGAVSPLFVESVPASRATAAIRIAAVKAISGTGASPVRSLLIIGIDTAAGPGQLAANLAAAISQSGQRVTLLDATEDSGEATTLMAAVDLPGTAELLDDGDGPQIRISDVRLQRWAGIEVIPRGSRAPRTLNPGRVTRLLAELAKGNDLTIVTASPVHVSGSALVWGRACDATVVVPRRDGTKRESFTDALESLRLVGARPTGVILYERPSSLVLPSVGRGPAVQPQRAQAVALDGDRTAPPIRRTRDAKPDPGAAAPAPPRSRARRRAAARAAHPPDGSAR